MKKWGIKFRLALSMTGHVVLLLFLAFYLNISLLSIRRHDPESEQRQIQWASTVTLPALVHDMETSFLAVLKNGAPEDQSGYQSARARVQEALTSLEKSALPEDYFELQRRNSVRQWQHFTETALQTPHPTQAMAKALQDQAEKLYQEIVARNADVQNEAQQALQGIQDEEMDETRGRILLMWSLVALVTCATTLIQYFTSNSIIQPLQKLSDVLRRFQKGDIAVRAHLKSGGEIETLGEIFNAMASSIQRNQDALYQDNARLEERVAEKTRELEENNLKLQDASRLKDQFFASLSHELRTPLTPILSCAHLLQEGKRLAPEEEKTVQMIERNARALSRMIDELLSLSAIIYQKISFSLEKTELNAWALATLESLRPAWEKKELKLVLHLAPEPVQMEIDPGRLAQILTNLLNNAIKFTPPGGTITLQLKADEKKIWLSVRDTGIGLPQEELNPVFELFHQAKSNRGLKTGGLGIGLTVARSLAELHGGGLSAESAGLGHGATFTLWLPREQPGAELAPEIKPRLPMEKLRGRRLLLVEDSPDALEALQRIFQRRGCEVYTASDGPAGLALAREKKPEIILSDIGLPGMSGLEMMRLIRQEPELRGLLAIAVSGLGRAEDVTAAREAGFDTHLLKPIEIYLLDQTLTLALTERTQTLG